MIEAFQHKRLTVEHAPARAGIRFDDETGDVARRVRGRIGDDLRFFAIAYAGALAFFLGWLG